MKRGGPLQRRTPLKAKKSFTDSYREKQRTQAAEGGQNKGKGAPLQRVSKTSKKGRIAEGRPAFVSAMIQQAGGKCEAFVLLRYVDLDAARGCYGYATEVHEPLTRARGGATDDPVNSVCSCRSCHNYCHANEDQAWRVGLMLKSWETAEHGAQRRADVLRYGMKAVETEAP